MMLPRAPVAFIFVCALSCFFYSLEGASSCDPFQQWSLPFGRDILCKPLYYIFLLLVTNRETKKSPVRRDRFVSPKPKCLLAKGKPKLRWGSSSLTDWTAAPHKIPTSSCSPSRPRKLISQILVGLYPETWRKQIKQAWSAAVTCLSKFLYSGWFSKVSCHPQQQAKPCYKFKGVLVPNTGWPCSRLSVLTLTSHFEAEQPNEATDQTKTSRTSRETKEAVKCEHQEKGQKKKRTWKSVHHNPWWLLYLCCGCGRLFGNMRLWKYKGDRSWRESNIFY